MAPAQRRDVHLDVVFLDDNPRPTPAPISSSLLTTLPPAEANTQRMWSARLPSRTSLHRAAARAARGQVGAGRS